MSTKHMSLISRCGIFFTSTIELALLILLPVFIVGCSSPPASPPAPEPGVTDVSIQGFAFTPNEVTIRQGETVRWTNHESLEIAHTVTSGNPGDPNTGVIFDSGLLVPGESFSFQFNQVGEYVYFCRPHAAIMQGARVLVVP